MPENDDSREPLLSPRVKADEIGKTDPGNSDDLISLPPMDLRQEIIDTHAVDPVLANKMALVNAAIDEIGMTPFHWKLFFLNGFGYAVDSVRPLTGFIASDLSDLCRIASCCLPIHRAAGSHSGVRQPEPHDRRRVALITDRSASWGSRLGLLSGCHRSKTRLQLESVCLRHLRSRCWRHAWLHILQYNVSSPWLIPGIYSLTDLYYRVAIYSAGAGGNYILDATNFIEFLPVSHGWLVTFLAVWWAIGYTITGLLAWAFMSNFSCEPTATICTRANNMGWRYLHFACGGLVIVVSVGRLFGVRMVQTPKWLISQNRDVEAYENLLHISEKYSRPFSMSLDDLQSQGRVRNTEKSVWSAVRLTDHFSGLFSTRILAYSTVMIIINWLLVGTVGPLYGVFLPYYLKSRGAATGDGSNYTTWRNYAINQAAGLVGPVVAGFLVETRWFGRRGTLAVGAAITTVLQIGYTQVKTPAQNLSVSASISAASSIFYGTIYAYTPEILPSAHRATGYGLCVVLSRIGGIAGVLVGSYANVETATPLFICAGLHSILVITSLLLPFESKGKRSV